jgi:hypothetical protein
VENKVWRKYFSLKSKFDAALWKQIDDLKLMYDLPDAFILRLSYPQILLIAVELDLDDGFEMAARLFDLNQEKSNVFNLDESVVLSSENDEYIYILSSAIYCGIDRMSFSTLIIHGPSRDVFSYPSDDHTFGGCPEVFLHHSETLVGVQGSTRRSFPLIYEEKVVKFLCFNRSESAIKSSDHIQLT